MCVRSDTEEVELINKPFSKGCSRRVVKGKSKVLAITYLNTGSYEVAVVEENGNVRLLAGREARLSITNLEVPEIMKCENCGRLFHKKNIGLLRVNTGDTTNVIKALCRDCVLNVLKVFEKLIEECCT